MTLDEVILNLPHKHMQANRRLPPTAALAFAISTGLCSGDALVLQHDGAPALRLKHGRYGSAVAAH